MYMYCYCACGHRFLLASAWNGREAYLELRDEQQGTGSVAINHCPECGCPLRFEALARQSPPTVMTVMQEHPRFDARELQRRREAEAATVINQNEQDDSDAERAG